MKPHFIKKKRTGVTLPIGYKSNDSFIKIRSLNKVNKVIRNAWMNKEMLFIVW